LEAFWYDVVMAETKKYTPLIITLHVVIILLAYSSPFWLDWKLVALGVALNFVQLLVAGGCVLSLAQFEDKEQTFHEWYLKKFGVLVNRKPLNFTLRYIVPFVILSVAILFQVVAQTHVLTGF